MNSSREGQTDHPIDPLAGKLLDAGLSDAERAEFLQRSAADGEACDRLIEHMMLHAALRHEMSSYRPATLSESLFKQAPAAVPAALPLTAAEEHPLTEAIRPSATPGFFTAGVLGWTSFAAVVAVVAASAWWAAPFATSKNESRDRATSVVQLGVSSVRLDSGTANLKLPGIGYVIVEEPAEFDLIDPMRARLTRGRIKMRVTEKSGHGFVVETPYGNVMDLGTEFALDVSDAGQAGLVVFDGEVDLQVAESSERPDFSRVERLVRGEGVTFNEGGQLDRIMSIVTGGATFQSRGGDASDRVILDVFDNRRTSETKKFYEIVPGGLCEDALAYVDRPEHEWNGVTSAGMPQYLLGADYIKPFNDDKVQKDITVSVAIGRPAHLYVFFDDRLTAPDWLKRDFQKTEDKIGLDVGDWSGSKRHFVRGVGPGARIDQRFSIWLRVVKKPCTLTLGPNASDPVSKSSGMYGIAAVALNEES